MTNIDRLRDLYADKRTLGLTGVKFGVDRSGNPTTEDIAGEILAMEAAPKQPLDFGDLHWKKPTA